MPSRPKPPPEDEIDEMFVKGTGPGGQKINKTNSAVQLRHKPTGIVVKSQATRSRTQNRAIARAHLAARLDELANGDQSRTAVVAAVKIKKRANATKKTRRKYRKLEEEAEAEKAAATAGTGGEVAQATGLTAGAAAFMASATAFTEEASSESELVLTDADILQRIDGLRQADQYDGREEDEDDEEEEIMEQEEEDEEEDEEEEEDEKDEENEEDEGEEDNNEEVWTEPSMLEEKARADR
ncbi:hypothetical protein Sste5346_004941 [Sporothrix stenoceras]|uniref:Prokaryotic-type class I peptide chain release factors domain-containing protein n=1 Tax=Sporothrix stenoceras TaxID=5173 RepID=A0ABR3Z6E8_9PEZI